ncbi:MAG: ferrous iron transporter B, partial [Candidatus Melainabacteria bacterium HGW-Melainabacteria-1]
GAPPEHTVLGISARVVAPVFVPLGFGERWEAVASILPGFMAKEMVVGTMGVVLSVQQVEPATAGADFGKEFLSQASGFRDASLTAAGAVVGNLLPAPFQLERADQDSPLMQAVRTTFTPLSAFSFMVFNLLLLSCVSVVGAMMHEFGSRYLGFVLGITTGTAYVAALLVFQFGRLLGYG